MTVRWHPCRSARNLAGRRGGGTAQRACSGTGGIRVREVAHEASVGGLALHEASRRTPTAPGPCSAGDALVRATDPPDGCPRRCPARCVRAGELLPPIHELQPCRRASTCSRWSGRSRRAAGPRPVGRCAARRPPWSRFSAPMPSIRPTYGWWPARRISPAPATGPGSPSRPRPRRTSRRRGRCGTSPTHPLRQESSPGAARSRTRS